MASTPAEADKFTGSARPLAGLRVLDLTQFLAGPFGTMILSDLGADVIKVEPPDGELSRHLPPYFVEEDSVYYLSVNRGKRSLCLDLKHDRGREVLRKLIAESDVLIESFRPGVIDRLGLKPDEILQEHPEMIWCSISGFGQSGPDRDLPAYDMIVQALSGGMSLTGEPDGESVRAGVPIGDLAAGMYAVIGILAALNQRGGEVSARRIDISMLDCQVSMLSYQLAYYLHSGNVPKRQGSAHDSIPTYRSFTAGEGTSLVITANTEKMWASLADVLSRPELVEDERFTTNQLRLINRIDLFAIIEPIFLSKKAKDWVDLLRSAGVPAAEIKTLDQVAEDSQVNHRNMIRAIADSAGHSIRTAGNPIKFIDHQESEFVYPPRLGEHSKTILSDLLKVPGAEIEQLIEEGALVVN